MTLVNNLKSYSEVKNPQFRGLSSLKWVSAKQRKQSAEIISNILWQDEKEILSLTKHASVKQMGFLQQLADRYNKENFYKKVGEKEDSKLVNEIFKYIKFPNSTYVNLVKYFEGSLRDLYRIFRDVNDDANRLSFVKKINNDVLSRNFNSYQNLLPELLESPNSEEYIKNYSKYKSYLKLYGENKNVVKNLDEMLASGKYNQEDYDKKLKQSRIKNQFILPSTENFSADDYLENYSTAGRKFLKYISSNLFLSEGLLSADNDKVLLEMYKTSTNQNIKLRKAIMEVFSKIFVPTGYQKEYQIAQLKELNELYKKIDEDINAQKFIKYFVNKPFYNAVSINGINRVFSEIPSLKLLIFKENAKRIICRINGDERLNVLKSELENPFFETKESKKSRKIAEQYGFMKTRTKLQDFIKKVKNKINILRYKKYRDLELPQDTGSKVRLEEKNKEVIPDAMKVDNNKLNNDNIMSLEGITSVVSNEDNNVGTILVKNEDIKKRVQDIETILKRPTDYKNTAESYVALSPTNSNQAEKQHLYNELFSKEISTPETREKVSEISEQLGLSVNYAGIIDDMIPIPLTEEQYSSRSKELEKVFSRKNLTKQDVYLYIQKKLGSKTLSTQKDAYKANATKMKLDMLPEIFASIAETRKADRAVGKYHINSSNKDALDLYLLINGNNKKYINYLLKKRNVDNTRMFEVKDIIAIIRKAEDRINKEKSNNPLFSSKDAKNYYNHLYESKIQQYGKVKRGVSNKA